MEDGDVSGAGMPAGEPVPLLQPAARTSTAAAEMEKRASRLFMMNLSGRAQIALSWNGDEIAFYFALGGSGICDHPDRGIHALVNVAVVRVGARFSKGKAECFAFSCELGVKGAVRALRGPQSGALVDSFEAARCHRVGDRLIIAPGDGCAHFHGGGGGIEHQ